MRPPDIVDQRATARAKTRGARIALDAIDAGHWPRRAALLGAVAQLVGSAAQHQAIAEESAIDLGVG